MAKEVLSAVSACPARPTDRDTGEDAWFAPLVYSYHKLRGGFRGVSESNLKVTIIYSFSPLRPAAEPEAQQAAEYE